MGLWTGESRTACSAGDQVGLETREGSEKKRHKIDEGKHPAPTEGTSPSQLHSEGVPAETDREAKGTSSPGHPTCNFCSCQEC